VTAFLDEHPGGSKIILKYAGKDATEAYEPIHPPDTLDKYLPKDKHLGEVDMGTVAKEEKEFDPYEEERQKNIERMPILEQCYNLMDFEAVARKVMTRTAWAYYSSAADDEIVSLQILLYLIPPNTATDITRKPQRLPQDLVPSTGACRCGESRHVYNHVGYQGRHTLLRYRYGARQAWKPRRRSRLDTGRKEAQRYSDDPNISVLLV
jgi:hypothetical protein